IDGTLTQTYQADEACFVQALREVFGFSDIDTDWAGYPHCSDSGILETLFQMRFGRPPLRTEISTFQAHFVSLLIDSTIVQPFNTITGPRHFLLSLTRCPPLVVSFATGAWERSARFKLVSTVIDVPLSPSA